MPHFYQIICKLVLTKSEFLHFVDEEDGSFFTLENIYFINASHLIISKRLIPSSKNSFAFINFHLYTL